MMKKPALAIFFTFLFFTLYAQEWERIYPIQGEFGNTWFFLPVPTSVSVTNDGYYLFGRYVFKLDNQGDTVWVEPYYSSNGVATADGGAVLIKRDVDTVSGSFKRLDADGDILWTKPYVGRFVIEDGGGFVFYNESVVYDDEGNWSELITLTKVALDGMVYWEEELDLPMSFNCYNLIKTNDGGFLMSGRIGSNGAVLYANSIGELQWYNTYPSFGPPTFASSDVVYSAVNTTGFQQNDAGYILVGTSNLFGDGDLHVFKIDLAGELVWSQVYPCEYGDCAQYNASIVEANDGFLAVAEVDSRLRILKINWLGEKEWETYYGNSVQLKTGNALQRTNDGGFVITGMSFVSNDISEGYNVFVLKLDETAELLSITEPEEEALIFYPNPTAEVLYFNSEEEKSIHSVFGQRLLSTSEKEIDVSSLAAGVYLIKEGVRSSSFIKK